MAIVVACGGWALSLPGRAERASSPDPAHALDGAALVRALRAGGLTLYFRHTATDFSRNDAKMTSHEDCATQRLLSDSGRAQARVIGEHIRALSIPVGEVLASPFCRTMDTGRLMFGRATAAVSVRGYVGTDTSRADYRALDTLLATPPAAGTVRAVTGHGNPFRAIAGPPHLAEGEAAVIKPLGDRWVVVARIAPEGWSALAAAAR